MSAGPDFGDLYPRFAALAGELIGFDRLSISSVDPATGVMEVLHADGVFLPDRQIGFGHPINSTLVGSMIEKGRVVGIDGATLSEKWPGADELTAAGLQSVLVASLMIEGSIVGVMLMAKKDPAGFAAGELALAGQIASQISGPIASQLRRTGIYKQLAVFGGQPALT